MKLRDRALGTVLAVFFAASAGGAVASVASPAELLGQIPANVLEVAFPAEGSPGPGGLLGKNSGGWESVGFQRGVEPRIVAGAVRHDAHLIDRWWPVIDASFAHEHPDGSFDFADVIDGVPQQHDYQFPAEAFWIRQSAFALLVLRSSDLGPRYGARIDALLPKYRSAVAYLAANSAGMLHEDWDVRTNRGAANRLLIDVEALTLGDRLAGVPAAQAVARRLLDIALAAQTPAGDFPERGGSDSSYNAVACSVLAELMMFSDDSRLPGAERRCESWELGRVRDSGEVDVSGNTRVPLSYAGRNAGPLKSVDYSSVARMFAYAAVLQGDAGALDAAQRTAAFWLSARS